MNLHGATKEMLKKEIRKGKPGQTVTLRIKRDGKERDVRVRLGEYTEEDAWREMNDLIPRAQFMGADIMRIVASSLMFRNEPHGPQIEAIVNMLKESVKIAEDCGVVLAIENHIDYTSAEIEEILERVGSKSLKVNFDTGNTLRMMEDPVAAARRLGPYTVATHTKDVDACRHVRPEEWYFFSSVPVGTGLIDMPGVVRALKESGFDGVLAVESDHHKDNQDEDKLVADSVAYLKQLLKIQCVVNPPD